MASPQIDVDRFTRSQAQALTTVLELQRAVHLSPNYKQHLSTLILRALPFDDLCVVCQALIPTIHLAQGAAKKAEGV
jgi:hypothetical protein